MSRRPLVKTPETAPAPAFKPGFLYRVTFRRRVEIFAGTFLRPGVEHEVDGEYLNAVASDIMSIREA